MKKSRTRLLFSIAGILIVAACILASCDMPTTESEPRLIISATHNPPREGDEMMAKAENFSFRDVTLRWWLLTGENGPARMLPVHIGNTYPYQPLIPEEVAGVYIKATAEFPGKNVEIQSNIIGPVLPASP